MAFAGATTNERLPLGISQRAKGGETGNARSTTREVALGIVLDFTHERSGRGYYTLVPLVDARRAFVQELLNAFLHGLPALRVGSEMR